MPKGIFFLLLQFNVLHVSLIWLMHTPFANINGNRYFQNWTACTYALHNIILYIFVKHDMSEADRYTHNVIRSYTSAEFRNTTFILSHLNANSIWRGELNATHKERPRISLRSRRILLVQIIIINGIGIDSDIIRNILLFVSIVNAAQNRISELIVCRFAFSLAAI